MPSTNCIHIFIYKEKKKNGGKEETSLGGIGLDDLLKESQKQQILGYRNFVQQQNREFAKRFGLPYHETEAGHT